MNLPSARPLPKVPFKTGGSSALSITLQNILVAVLAVCLIAFAAVTLVVLFVGHRVLLLAFKPIDRLLGLIVGMVMVIVLSITQQIVTWLVVGSLIGGGIYLLMEANPEWRYRIDTMVQHMHRGVENLTGFTLPEFRIPGVKDAMDMLTSPGSPGNPNPLHPSKIEEDLKELTRIKDIKMPSVPTIAAPSLPSVPSVHLPSLQEMGLPDDIQLPQIPDSALLKDVVKEALVPKEFQSLVDVAMDPKMMAYYKVLLESGALKQNENAVLPLLKAGLATRDNPELRRASYKALSQMRSPEAQYLFREYQKLLQEAMKNANKAANTGH